MKHLAIDCGRNAVKVIGPGYTDWFPSVVGEARSLRLTNNMRSTDIILKEKDLGEWYLGDLARDESAGAGIMMFADKVHRDTKILILAAVARAVHDGENVKITTGVPIYSHTALTKQKVNLLLCGNYDVEINSKRKKFSIQDVKVATEGAAAYMSLCPGLGGVKRFIDIGSRTVNYGTVVNGRYIDRESGTFDYGLGYGTESTPAMFARRLAADISRVWPQSLGEVYLFGGGAKRCSEELMSFIPGLICATQPEFVNACAFYAIGERVVR